MTELEQLRKEVNELRERLVRVEQAAVKWTPFGGIPFQQHPSYPKWDIESPYKVTC